MAAGMEPGPHADLLTAGVTADGEAWRALAAGRPGEARRRLREAAGLYRRSYELAPPRSYGRVVAHLKSALIGGGPPDAAAWARAALDDACDSPTSCYALALARLAEGDDQGALAACEGMRAGDAAFGRAADAIAALARRDREAYAAALTAIVADFAARDAHLTGVAIADTALLMQALAAHRGMAVPPDPPLLPALA